MDDYISNIDIEFCFLALFNYNQLLFVTFLKYIKNIFYVQHTPIQSVLFFEISSLFMQWW